MYKVSIEGESVGYIKNKQELEDKINTQILQSKEENLVSINLKTNPTYELKLVSKDEPTSEEEILIALKEKTLKTYKFYSVTLADVNQAYVDTIEEAEEVVNKIKEEYNQDLELDLKIIEQYTENKEEVKNTSIEVAKQNIENVIEKKLDDESIAVINSIRLSVLPINGTITSRYGAVSRIRVSTHTGLDIANVTGTNIKVVAKGTVSFAQKSGSYGNLVKVNHGNGVETWYAHCSKIYAKVGQEVKAGDIIAAVGSTGNSTGPHLHFEIRINGKTVNPQNYMYK